tara:strand:+ start:11509 stop:12654 length:1146 start_codon:yes stop_codon:yes gene_type:complete
MAFSGKPTYGAFTVEVAKDVSPIISLLSPRVTPFLDFIGDPTRAANVAIGSIEHNWLEDELTPQFTLTVSSAINSATAATGIQVDAWGDNVQEGDILRLGGFDTTEELLEVTSAVGANSILVNRAFGGTTNFSLAAGGTLGFVANAKHEGEDRKNDISRVRVNKQNWVQYFAKPIEVSATMEAVIKEGGVGSEYAYQATDRVETAIRDLESAVLLGSSTSTIGDGSTRRAMKGMWRWITSTHTAVTVTQSFIDNAILTGYLLGAAEYDYIVCGARVKLGFDRLPGVAVVQPRSEQTVGTQVTLYQSGLSTTPLRVINSRQMDARGFIIGRSDDLAVLPLRDRSFQLKNYAETKDSRQGELVGEYTAEVRRAATQVRGYITG